MSNILEVKDLKRKHMAALKAVQKHQLSGTRRERS